MPREFSPEELDDLMAEVDERAGIMEAVSPSEVRKAVEHVLDDRDIPHNERDQYRAAIGTVFTDRLIAEISRIGDPPERPKPQKPESWHDGRDNY